MAVACDQCDKIFEHNYKLYKHKVEEHGPVTGLITKTLKRPVQPHSGRYKHVRKYRKTIGDEHPTTVDTTIPENPKDSADDTR